MKSLTEHEMLVTLANMAYALDVTGHDIVEALREHGYGHIAEEARQKHDRRR